mgnify:CR=1 FL=1
MKKLLILTLIFCSLFSCKKEKAIEENIIQSNFEFASSQLIQAITEIENILSKTEKKSTINKKQEPLISPRSIDNQGNLLLVSSRDWTSGFFPGELWYMYEYTKDPRWEKLAREYTAPIEQEKMNGKTHDMGFKVYCSFGNGYRLTKDSIYKQILLEAAYTLTTRYKPNAKIIRSWDHNKDKWQCPVIIDNMMNLELLFWAFKETKDSLFYTIAVNHATTTLKNHFRPDYSSYHVIDYDTITGEVLKRNTHQGYAHESAWSRGQAWAIYGYTMCYRETNQLDFLEQAKQIVNYVFTHPNLPQDLIPYWDFDAPEIPNEPRDVSAATIMASALYELSLYDESNAEQYKKWADTLLENLTKSYLAKPNEEHGFLLLHSTGSKPGNFEVDAPLVYADYYFLEALIRKQKIEQTGKLF